MGVNKSVLRAIEMLELIAQNNTGITLTEIANELELPMASASDILKALLSKQMVELDNSRLKTYRLGVKNLQLGTVYQENIDIIALAKPFLDRLSQESKSTTFLAKLIDYGVVYIYKCQPKELLVTTCSIGSKSELTTTALGKSVLAFSESLWPQVFSRPLPKKTPNSITDPDKIRVELANVKANGYAVGNFEDNEHLLCLGFPIFDKNGSVEYSIGISNIFSESRDIEWEAELGKKYSQEISSLLGYVRE